MKKLSFQGKKHVYLLSIFLLGVVWNALSAWYFGGMLQSPDSSTYILVSHQITEVPTSFLPTGISYLLFFGERLGLNLAQVYALIVGNTSLFLFLLLSQKFSKKTGLAGVLLFLLEPAWLLLRITVWTEIAFIMVLTMMAYVLYLPKLTWNRKLIFSTFLFLGLSLIRRPGIFVYPAMALALGMTEVQTLWKFNLKKIILSGVTLLATWSALNWWSSSGLLSKHLPDGCGHALSSLNALPICQWDPTLRLCEKLKDRKFFNSWEDAPFWDLMDIQSGAYYPENLDRCETYSQAISLVIENAPLQYLGLLIKRAWGQFGPWQDTDMKYIKTREGFSYSDRLNILSQLFATWNQFQWLFQIFLVTSIILLLNPKYRRPELIFLAVGAIGYAFGIAVTNPYFSLRFSALPKFMISLCFGQLLFAMYWTKNNRLGKAYRKRSK